MIPIGLGTVQLGLKYGNQSHLPLMEDDVAQGILNQALSLGINFFDTAYDYGLSESRLGVAFSAVHSALTISTKVPKASRDIWSDSDKYFNFVTEKVKQSLGRLKLTSLKLLQFHQCDVEFLSHPGVHSAFSRLLKSGLCDEIGISVYTIEEAEAAMTSSSVSNLQVPINILDRRFYSPTLIAECNQKGIGLIGRSVFLQGILVPNASLPQLKKTPLLAHLKQLCEEAAKKNNATLPQLCCDFAFATLPDIYKVILVGVDSTKSLTEIMDWNKKSRKLDTQALAHFDEAVNFMQEHELYNPSTWAC